MATDSQSQRRRDRPFVLTGYSDLTVTEGRILIGPDQEEGVKGEPQQTSGARRVPSPNMFRLKGSLSHDMLLGVEQSQTRFRTNTGEERVRGAASASSQTPVSHNK